MKRLLLPLLLLGSLALPSVALAQTPPPQAGPCQFVLGFTTVAAAVPEVGQCKENQHDDGQGNQVQATTGGLLVWRKADNWTAFTDGYRTWINGPQGVRSRLNTERFPWEDGQPSAASCQFVLGFAALAQRLDPHVVGTCTENQHPDSIYGTVQHTTLGKFLWSGPGDRPTFNESSDLGGDMWLVEPNGLVADCRDVNGSSADFLCRYSDGSADETFNLGGLITTFHKSPGGVLTSTIH